MNAIEVTLIGFAPGLYWLWIFLRRRTFSPDAHRAAVQVFALGALSAVGVLRFRPNLELHFSGSLGFASELMDAFVVTALSEEAFKLIACVLGAFFFRRLKDPKEGLIYGAGAGLGFASCENVVYLIQTAEPSVVFYRAFTATLAHVGFTSSLAYAVALARFRTHFRVTMIAGAFLSAVVLHGTYNWLLWQGTPLNWLAILVILPLTLTALSLKWQSPKSEQSVMDV
ncbi:MAG TPA: PrsW family glutamic-type intramembrane protease, partial [Planctomycetota bacterium]|nr:PrsW family glutamic-type intramembrane protease [Planctomycetota bacterium]